MSLLAMLGLRYPARIAGGFYLLSFVFISTLTLYRQVHEMHFISSAAPETFRTLQNAGRHRLQTGHR